MTDKKTNDDSIRKHLTIKLRKGWTYDAARKQFTKDGKEPVSPGEHLPKYTQIKFKVPSMARKSNRTAAEDELARSLQILPPRDEHLEDVIEQIKELTCVEKAWISPDVTPAAPSAPIGMSKRRPKR